MVPKSRSVAICAVVSVVLLLGATSSLGATSASTVIADDGAQSNMEPYSISNVSNETDEPIPEDRQLVDRWLEAESGAIANITLNLTETGEAAIRIGDYDTVGYEVGLNVSAEEYDGEHIGIKMNTYQAGGGADNYTGIDNESDVFWGHDDGIEVDVAYLMIADRTWNVDDGDTPENASTLVRPLAVGDYALQVGDEWTGPPWDSDDEPEMNDEYDRGRLTINALSLPDDDDVHVLTAPADDDVEDFQKYQNATVTGSSIIAEEDHLFLSISDLGMEGMYHNRTIDGNPLTDGDNVSSLLHEHGITIEFEEDVIGHLEPGVWNSSPSDDNPLRVEFVNAKAYDGDRMILRIPTAHADYQDTESNLSVGERYDVSVRFTAANPYVDGTTVESQRVETHFDLRERSVAVDDVHTIIPAADHATIGGETTLAPGTDVDVVAASSSASAFLYREEVTVLPDLSRPEHRWSAPFDLSTYEAESPVDIEISHNDEVVASQESELYDPDNPPYARIVFDATAHRSVDVGEEAMLFVTLDNIGQKNTTPLDVVITVDDDPIREESFILEPGQDWRLLYDEFNTSEEREFEWDVTVTGVDTNNHARGTIVVESEEPDVTEVDNETVTDEHDDHAVNDTHEETTDDVDNDGRSSAETDSAVQETNQTTVTTEPDPADNDSDDGPDFTGALVDESPGFGVGIAVIAVFTIAIVLSRARR